MAPLDAIPLHILSTVIGSMPNRVAQSTTFDQLSKFWKFGCRLRREIDLAMVSLEPPLKLPIYIHDFLRDTIGLDDRATIQLWSTLKGYIWDSTEIQELTPREINLFLRHGNKDPRATERIGPFMFYPPSKFCQVCKARLGGHFRYAITYFSGNGAYGGYVSSLSCTACKIRYYPDYYVQHTIRKYYSAVVLPIIHFQERAFIDRSLCELFTAQMVFAWVSGSNCANIYNTCMANPHPEEVHHPSIWGPEKRFLTTEQVWDAFFLKALLRDSEVRGETLSLNDTGTQEARLRVAMEARNTRISQYGDWE